MGRLGRVLCESDFLNTAFIHQVDQVCYSTLMPLSPDGVVFWTGFTYKHIYKHNLLGSPLGVYHKQYLYYEKQGWILGPNTCTNMSCTSISRKTRESCHRTSKSCHSMSKSFYVLLRFGSRRIYSLSL